MSNQIAPRDLPQEIWRVASTLTGDMQKAALQKARSLGFDLNNGRIPIDETFINLTRHRDLLLDSINEHRFTLLPLKLQYRLLQRLQPVADALSSLVNGIDAFLALEDAVDDLSSEIWQNNLHNLSGQIL